MYAEENRKTSRKSLDHAADVKKNLGRGGTFVLGMLCSPSCYHSWFNSNATRSACQKTDWKTHREWCGSQDFWDYPHKPLLATPATFERPAALRCQLALIDADPEVLYTLAPGTDVRAHFHPSIFLPLFLLFYLFDCVSLTLTSF